MNNETIDLVIDLTIALEGLLCPECADKRSDPKAVNQRALKWIDRYVMNESSDPDGAGS